MPIRRVCLALFAVVLVAVPAAHAGAPGKWTQLGDADLANIDEATLARTADGVLHVVWTFPRRATTRWSMRRSRPTEPPRHRTSSRAGGRPSHQLQTCSQRRPASSSSSAAY